MLTENEGENSSSLLETIKGITMKDVAYTTGEDWEDLKAKQAWEGLKAEHVTKVWHKTLLNGVDHLSEAVASSKRDFTSDRDASRQPENEPEDGVVISKQLREAGVSARNEADIQEWLPLSVTNQGTLH